MRVLTVVGNRPQFIKSAPLSVALRETGIEERSVHTGQHYDASMSAVFYDELRLRPPDHALDLRTADVDALVEGISAVVRAERPDWVVVFGDTNTTLAGARASRGAGVRVAHVEAGLRSGDLSMPEERNRIEVDRVADLLLCPDEGSSATLGREGAPGDVRVVGDVMADATRLFLPLARRRHPASSGTPASLLVTVHRAANVEERRLARIVEGLNRLTEPILFPAHPRTAAALETFSLALGAHISLVAPLGYLELAASASRARVILTDSGGLQKEAYWYGVPCVTLRPSTEWLDTVRVGANVLVDDDPDAIVAAVAGARMPRERPVLYGDGHAAERIAAALQSARR